MLRTKSHEEYQRACALIPGGVNSPVRAFRGVGGQPVFIERGQGPFLFDVDGNRYIDYVLSWGPLVLGHAHPRVVEALKLAVDRGASYGAPTVLESELAEIVCDLVPSAEMVRFVNSGTEAVMSALRLARAYTGRSKIIKLEGCYHGHADSLLVKAGSGVATLGLPDSPGVPKGAVQDTLVAPFNDLDGVEKLLHANAGQVAALILEPVAGNMGVVLPQDGYLQGLRSLTQDHGVLLIFDEVMTGFRVSLGGAQSFYGVTPDLTTLGKVIGGGLPVGAYAGLKEIMQLVVPEGPMYQAGTLSGNPLAMTAGIETLKLLQAPGVFEDLVNRTERLCQGIGKAAQQARIDIVQHNVGAMFCVFFTTEPVVDWTTASRSDTSMYGKFFHHMLDQGVYLAPSQFEAGFTSTAHDDDIITSTVDAAERAFRALAA